MTLVLLYLRKTLLDKKQRRFPRLLLYSFKAWGMALLQETPVLKFGVIADVQYADTDDGYNYTRTNKRYYRGSLDRLKKALGLWENETDSSTDFILQLGDVLDGWNKRLNISEDALKTVVDAFSTFSNPVYHIWGNHEFYNFSTQFLLQSKLYSGQQQFCTPSKAETYYSCQPHPKLRILAMNCYEISLLANQKDSTHYETAVQYLKNNPNEDLNAPEGLIGINKRFLKFNGAVSNEQLVWLRQNLQEAQASKQNVIVVGHCGIHPAATDNMCLCWNYDEILETLQAFSNCVICYMAGHDHEGGNTVDETGILHLTFPGVIENGQDCDRATVYMYKSRLVFKGSGRVPDFSLELKFPL